MLEVSCKRDSIMLDEHQFYDKMTVLGSKVGVQRQVSKAVNFRSNINCVNVPRSMGGVVNDHESPCSYFGHPYRARYWMRVTGL